MLGALTSGLQQAAAETRVSVEQGLRKAVFLLAGGFLAAIGAGFLTAAAWIHLARAESLLIAALSIGAFYLVLALVLMLAGTRRVGRRRLPPAPAAAAAPPPPPQAGRRPSIGPAGSVVPPLMEAFFAGLRTAQDMRGSRRRRRPRTRDEDDW